MVELDIKARRGGFHLEVACHMQAPWTVIFGPSGAGKSTVLRMLAGLDRPDSGRIAIDGNVVNDEGSELRRLTRSAPHRPVGLAGQKPALFPHLSVAANVAYGLAQVPSGAKNQRIAEMLELVGAASFAERKPGSLSGGEAQRVALARTLAPMPRLLLLDEPLSALGAEARDKILTQLKEWLGERKMQTILVTHDAADALATDAEVVVMHEGRLAAQGAAQEVLADERRRLLARLEG